MTRVVRSSEVIIINGKREQRKSLVATDRY